MARSTGSGTSADDAVDRAIEALKTASPETALPAIERALKSAPEDARLWHLQGLIWREQDRRDLAIPSLKRAASLTPNHSLIAHGLARTLLEAGLPSVAAFAHAMRLTPNDPDVVKGMVAALVAERRIGDAIAGLEVALGRSPQWGDGHALLADLRWLAGEREGFTRSFDVALGRFPGDFDLRRLQMMALLHAEQYDEVLDRIARGRAALGDHPMFDVNETIVHAERGETARADALFEQLANIDDDAFQVRRVRHLLRAGRPAEAVEIIERWLDTPRAFSFWPYASIAWRMTGDPRWDWLEGNPDLVGVIDLGDRLPPLDALAGKLRELHTTRGQPLVQSVRGGSQTDGNLFQSIDPIFVHLREAIRTAVAEHAASLPEFDARHPLLGRAREPIRFTGSWSVRLSGGGFHSNHVHPMGWLSSALYVSLPPDLGPDRAGWLTLGDPDSKAMPLGLGPTRVIEPKPGRLALFPSWMWHGTLPFGEGERLTVAFDVAVPGEGGPPASR